MSDSISDITKILEDYKDVLIDDMKACVDETTKEAVVQLRSVNVPNAGKYGSWTDYKKGWTQKKASGKGNSYKKVIYNSTKYRLAHLLEFGTKPHAMPQGGRHPGSKEFSHITEIDEKAANNLIQRLRAKL